MCFRRWGFFPPSTVAVFFLFSRSCPFSSSRSPWPSRFSMSLSLRLRCRIFPVLLSSSWRFLSLSFVFLSLRLRSFSSCRRFVPFASSSSLCCVSGGTYQGSERTSTRNRVNSLQHLASSFVSRMTPAIPQSACEHSLQYRYKHTYPFQRHLLNASKLPNPTLHLHHAANIDTA